MPFEGKFVKTTVEGEKVFETTSPKSEAETSADLERIKREEADYAAELNRKNPDIFNPPQEGAQEKE